MNITTTKFESASLTLKRLAKLTEDNQYTLTRSVEKDKADLILEKPDIYHLISKGRRLASFREEDVHRAEVLPDGEIIVLLDAATLRLRLHKVELKSCEQRDIKNLLS